MRIPLAADLESVDGSLLRGARLENCLIEPKGEGEFAVVRKRPGTTSIGTVGSSSPPAVNEPQGMISWHGIRAIVGDRFISGTLDTVHAPGNNGEALPSQTVTGLRFSMQGTGSAAATPYLMLKNRVQAWYSDRFGTPTLISYGATMGSETYPVESLTSVTTTATAVISGNPDISVGDTVTVSGASDALYNGAQTVLTVTPNSYEEPRTFGVTVTRSGTTATATTVYGEHGLTTGDTVTIAGANESAYNGSYTVTVVDTTNFTYTVTVTPVSAVTWNSADKSANVTLSGSDLIATIDNSNSAIYSGVRGTVGKSTGKWYWEVVSTSAISYGFGVASTSQSLDGAPGVAPDLYSISVVDSTVYTWGLALDMDSKVLTVYRDGAVALTFTGLSGTLYPYVGARNFTAGVPSVLTANFGASAFTHSAPEGFSPLDTDTPISPASGTITATIANVVQDYAITFAVDAGADDAPTGSIYITQTGGTVPGIPYINGYFCVMDVDGLIYNSDADDPTTWGALNFVAAEYAQGSGVSLTSSQNYLIALKEWSTEFFYDAANATGSPFSPVDNGFTKIGCAAGWSVAEVGDYVLFVSQTKDSGRGVHMMRGTEQVKVSTPDIDRVLLDDDMADVFAHGVTMDGHPLYLLTLGTSNLTLCYDLISKAWTRIGSATVAGSSSTVSSITRSGNIATATTSSAHGFEDGDVVYVTSATQTQYNGYVLVKVPTSTTFTYVVDGDPLTPATTAGTITAARCTQGKFNYPVICSHDGVALGINSDTLMASFSDESYLEAGSVPIICSIRTRKTDGGTSDLKKLARVTVVGDKGVGSALLRWTDDEFESTSSFRELDMSEDEPMVRRCGSFRKRQFELRHVSAYPLKVQALDLEVGNG